jgi:hypothetical protein
LRTSMEGLHIHDHVYGSTHPGGPHTHEIPQHSHQAFPTAISISINAYAICVNLAP